MTVLCQVCTRCVMDSTDPLIRFDKNGICNHCHDYDKSSGESVMTGEEGKRRVDEFAAEAKKAGVGKKYDCIIGVSGGVDSTFVAYKVKEAGLRPLAIHLDNGWDSELAKDNIAKLVKKTDIDLYTYAVDWEEFKDLQLAFLKAATPDSEIPTDHAIVSLLYRMSDESGVRYVVIGRNVRTESHMSPAWSTGHFDWKYIQSVHKQFGSVALKTYPYRTREMEIKYSLKQVWFNILDCVDYVKKDAIKILRREFDWEDYGGKHCESIYTRFFQGYILPKRFGFDKRKSHFSSLICSGEMTREEALEELKKEPYPREMREEDKVYVLKRLGLTEKEFEELMQLPKKTIYDYPSYARD